MNTYMGDPMPYKNGEFTYKKTPQKVEEYFIDLMGESKAKELMKAMKNRQWIIISGPHRATGKTTLADVLRAIGYTFVIEEWQTKAIQICEALTDLREKNDIFESLGIFEKH